MKTPRDYEFSSPARCVRLSHGPEGGEQHLWLSVAQIEALYVVAVGDRYTDPRTGASEVRVRVSKATRCTAPWCLSINSNAARALEEMELIATTMRDDFGAYYAELTANGAAALTPIRMETAIMPRVRGLQDVQERSYRDHESREARR